jgi:hypothetical protein
MLSLCPLLDTWPAPGLERPEEPAPRLEPRRSRSRSARLRRATWILVGIGVLLRLLIFALHFPLWGDEAFVAVNFIGRGYRALLEPLDYGQICPLLFLWLELTAVKLFGFSEWPLRLIPMLSSVAGVFLFAHLAGRVTRGLARLLAVGVFAIAYYPIRHGAEVKPYSTDLLTALVLLALAIEWWHARGKTRWLWVWALAAAVPLALGLSYPSVFLAGGISLALARPAWTARRQGALLPFVVYNLLLAGAFLFWFLLSTSVQERAGLETLRTHYWAAAFPPLARPWELIGWLVEAHTGRMFAYPFGGPQGTSSATTVCFTVALLTLWRRRRRRDGALLLLALGPFALTFVAAALGHYPYGGSARTMIFTAPMICLLGGLGLAVLINGLPGSPWRRLAVRTAVSALVLAGLILLGLTLTRPYKSLADENSRRFARWFWTEKSKDAELVCVKADLGNGFNLRNWSLFRSALYLCNQKIYSPRHRQGRSADWEAVSAGRPLRCVLYNEWPETSPACAAWLAGMTAHYRLIDRETFIINESAHHDDGTDIEDRYTVFTFRADAPSGTARPLSAVPHRAPGPAPDRG